MRPSCGRVTRFASPSDVCPSLCPSVSLGRRSNSKIKSDDEPKLVSALLLDRVTGVTIFIFFNLKGQDSRSPDDNNFQKMTRISQSCAVT